MSDESCIICLGDINKKHYAIIDETTMNQKYCVKCIDKWITENKRGVMTTNKTNTYHIYTNDDCIDTVTIDDVVVVDIDDSVNNENNDIIVDDNTTTEINLCSTDGPPELLMFRIIAFSVFCSMGLSIFGLGIYHIVVVLFMKN